MRNLLRFARIEFAEVDRFGGVAVGLGPALPHLVHHHGAHLMTPLSKQPGRAKEHVGPLLVRRPSPRLERLERRIDGLGDVLHGALREIPHAFRGIRGIGALEGLRGGDPLPADHQRVGGAEFRANLLQRRALAGSSAGGQNG